MNWWQQWKWFKENTSNKAAVNFRFKRMGKIKKRTYFLLLDPDIALGSFEIRRNWIEKL